MKYFATGAALMLAGCSHPEPKPLPSRSLLDIEFTPRMRFRVT